MTTQTNILPTAPANGATSAHELFALTDEQILEIEPVAARDEAGVEQPLLAVPPNSAQKAEPTSRNARLRQADQASSADQPAQAGVPVLPVQSQGLQVQPLKPAEPPAWLARQMKDPWAGEEARELWDGVLRAQAEAAEYRAAIATPAEAKSLKEIYPGGVEQARAAAERARMLDEFDAAYFGAAGKSAEEMSAARTALAQKMLRDDPAAFREMVAAGIEAIKRAGSGNVAPGFSPASERLGASTIADDAALKGGATQPSSTANAVSEGHVVAYGEFEKAANAELEKSVGSAIEHALRHALPNAANADGDALTARLSAGVRQEIERALQGDRQLGEQVAQVLASLRFDDTARAQVVRLISDRAQQLVPTATKRVLNDWTQTTLAAHRAKTEKQEAASQRADLAPAQQGREQTAAASQQRTANRVDAPPPPRGRIDYKKLTDEQILEL